MTGRCITQVETGGEKGLCQRHFPEEPIFTTKAFMTIVFRSTNPSPMENGQEPGFKLVLTATKIASSRGVCETDYFFCGRQPQLRMTEGYLGAYPSMQADRLSPSLKNRTYENRQMTRILPQNNRFGSQDLRAKRLDSLDRTISGYCIPQSLQCDGIVHCHNARDELPSLRIEPSQIPGHLLRDLVGTHLVPTDLQNVGCVRYRINGQRPRIRQNPNTSDRSRRLKNESHYRIGSQLAFQESVILTVGCVGMFIFVGLVLLCSYHQCSRSRRFRGQHLMPKRTAHNSVLISHVTRSDYELNKRIDNAPSTIQVRNSATYPNRQLGRLLSGPVINQSVPLFWTHTHHPMSRTVTRSTLDSMVGSHQTSTTGQNISQNVRSETHSSSAGDHDRVSACSPRPRISKLTRSKSSSLSQSTCLPLEEDTGERITHVQQQQTLQQQRRKRTHRSKQLHHWLGTRQLYPVQVAQPNQHPNGKNRSESASNPTEPINEDNARTNWARGPARRQHIRTYRFLRIQDQNNKICCNEFGLPPSIWFRESDPGRCEELEQIPLGKTGKWKQSPPLPPPYPLDQKRPKWEDNPRCLAQIHSLSHSKRRKASAPSHLRPSLRRTNSASTGRSKTNETKLGQKKTDNILPCADEYQPSSTKKFNQILRNRGNPLKSETFGDSKIRVTFAPGPKTANRRREHRIGKDAEIRPRSKTSESAQPTYFERNQLWRTHETLTNLVYPRASVHHPNELRRCRNAKCPCQAITSSTVEEYELEGVENEYNTGTSSVVGTSDLTSEDGRGGIAPHMCVNDTRKHSANGMGERTSLMGRSFSESELHSFPEAT